MLRKLISINCAWPDLAERIALYKAKLLNTFKDVETISREWRIYDFLNKDLASLPLIRTLTLNNDDRTKMEVNRSIPPMTFKEILGGVDDIKRAGFVRE